ncbi:MAG: CD0415/CD1112 family protein [Clostridia bacterium]|nr:CD0415/CD1112 family protein [Clostridia bacterium]
MFDIFGEIEEWFRSLLTGFITSNMTTMFTDVNDKTSSIAGEVSKTPQQWNASVFSMIQSISSSVIIPIASIIIALVMTYELISMIIEKNNMHDVDTWMIFRWVFKAFITITLVSNTFQITMAIFEVGQSIVNSASAIVGSNSAVNVDEVVGNLETLLEDMEIGEMLLLTIESLIMSLAMKIISLLITVVLYVRMMEIYIYTSVAPIPFSTLMNREWGNIGNNYIRGLVALAFQGFFIMVIVGIYCALVNSVTVSSDIHSAMFELGAFTVLLCFALFKTSSISKSIMGAH